MDQRIWATGSRALRFQAPTHRRARQCFASGHSRDWRIGNAPSRANLCMGHTSTQQRKRYRGEIRRTEQCSVERMLRHPSSGRDVGSRAARPEPLKSPPLYLTLTKLVVSLPCGHRARGQHNDNLGTSACAHPGPDREGQSGGQLSQTGCAHCAQACDLRGTGSAGATLRPSGPHPRALARRHDWPRAKGLRPTRGGGAHHARVRCSPPGCACNAAGCR
jgi:hypothetical protein